MSAKIRIAAIAVTGLVVCGCAATSQNVNPKPAPSAAMSNDPNCLTDTGSRLAFGKSNCRAYGRSYSNADIERTGSTDAATALGLLDPSITVHR
jgi:hypothetical protein